MKLVIIRHGIAEDMAAEDRLRKLTDEGKKKMRQNVKGIQAIVDNIDLFVSSPLVRAQETAEIVREAYPKSEVAVCDALEPWREVNDIVDWLNARPLEGTVALVGHNPHFSELAGYLLTGSGQSFFDVKKGSLIVFEGEGRLAPGQVELRCFVQPRELRKIGKTKVDS